MSATVIVGRAAPKDLDAVAGLFAAYLRFYGRSAQPTVIRRFLDARMSRGESVMLVARTADAVVGFAQLYPTFSSLRLAPAWIANDLFVDPAARGLRVARALCEHAIELARASGACAIELQTAHDNHAAQALYRSLGFEPETELATWTLGLLRPE